MVMMMMMMMMMAGSQKHIAVLAAKDQIKFGESVWSLPLVLDFRRFPLWDSIFAMLLFLVNLGMQALFSSILLSDDFTEAGVQVEEEKENARRWRVSIAHDWRYMDLSETSLVTRVCQSDGALILSTPQVGSGDNNLIF